MTVDLAIPYDGRPMRPSYPRPPCRRPRREATVKPLSGPLTVPNGGPKSDTRSLSLTYRYSVRIEASRKLSFRGFRTVRVLAVTYYSAWSLLTLPRVLVDPAVGGRFWPGLLFGSLLTPLLWWALWTGVHDRRPRYLGWLFAAIIAVEIGGTVAVGVDWLPAYHTLMVLALIYLPLPWALIPYGVVWLAVLVLPSLFGHPQETLFHGWGGLAGGLMGAVVFWLLQAYQRLLTARAALANEAIVSERVRIDAELEQTLGTALREVVTHADRAGQAVDAAEPEAAQSEAAQSDVAGTSDLVDTADVADSRGELTAMVGVSRAALTETRQLVRRFQSTSPRDELNTAVGLLAAAGVRTELDLPAGDPPGTADQIRPVLRAELARVLARDDIRECVITAYPADDGVRVEFTTDPPRRPGDRASSDSASSDRAPSDSAPNARESGP